jgi:hypothetical protein
MESHSMRQLRVCKTPAYLSAIAKCGPARGGGAPERRDAS